MLKSRRSTFAVHRLDENVRGGVSMQCDAGKAQMKAPKITRRLVAVGVIASAIVALTSSLASAAPTPVPVCIGSISIKLQILDTATGRPFPGMVIEAGRKDPQTGFPIQTRSVELGQLDMNGNGQFQLPVWASFCAPPPPGIATFTVWWVDNKWGKVHELTTVTIRGPFIPLPGPKVDLGTNYVTQP